VPLPALAQLGPTVLIAHNIEHASAAQNAAYASSALMRWLYAREERLLKQLETRLASGCGYIWCLAEEDRRALAAITDSELLQRSAVLPLVSTSGGQRLDDSTTPKHDIGLIGTWTWEPNLIGLRWFFSEVVPLLPESLDIAVAGRLPAGLAAPANVKLLGRVPDATAFLADCAVNALVSRAGTGVQLKTIETLQLGLPAVSTTLSMRGLGTPPANVRLADEPLAFAQALAEHVADVRSGRIRRLDGGVFMQAQAKALSEAISDGLRKSSARG
jgi:hypothetical protein